MTATLTTLVSFFSADGLSGDAVNGARPFGDLIADAKGDLFGTTSNGGANGPVGTVFEIIKTAGGYASTPTTLASFNVDDGSEPFAGLLADSNGDLFGTTDDGPAGFDGTVFEIAKTPAGYASTPITVADTGYASSPKGSLIADANGDLLGTTSGGNGTVFEIAKTAIGYASTPTTLVSFNGADGAVPLGSLIADANGDLFGTTEMGGAIGVGTVFEIAKTPTGYASTPTTLVNFTRDNFGGALPRAA